MAIEDIQRQIDRYLLGYSYTSPWKRKYAWFPILLEDWSIIWFRWYKTRFVLTRRGHYGKTRLSSCRTEYIIEQR